MPSRMLIPTSVLALVAVALLAAGCGGGGPSPSLAASGQSELVAYSHCMRSHGVPTFPEPVAGQGIGKARIVQLAGSPQFSVASSACQHLLPEDGLGPQTTPMPTRTRLADGLAFSRCLRDHGFSDFPDPTAQGQLTPEMVTAAGIDLHQKALLQAGLACAPVSHGLITRAAVERAVNGR